jgi:hypothetical protein
MGVHARRTELRQYDGALLHRLLQSGLLDPPDDLLRAEGPLAGGAPDIDAFRV